MHEYSFSLFVNGEPDGVETELCENESDARVTLWLFLMAVLTDEPERFCDAGLVTADLSDGQGRTVWRLSLASGRLQ